MAINLFSNVIDESVLDSLDKETLEALQKILNKI